MLATFTDPAVPYTRRSFSPRYQEARRWLASRFTAAGLQTHTDGGGNLIGTLRGTRANAAPIASGSHTDTVPGGGRFDGIIGVLAGIEVARSLRDGGVALRHPFEVIDFLAEEPSEYGVSCIGSRAIAGSLGADMLASTAPGGETLATGIARMGGDPDVLARPLRAANSVAAFFELHIEQGPVLEQRELPIGVVTDIVGIRRYELTFTGRADHAGTTPMELRSDALVAAARFIEWASREAARRHDDATYVVATVGKLAIEPNASNVVPALARLTIEVRSNAELALDDFVAALLERAQRIAADSTTAVAAVEVSRSPATACAPELQGDISAACDAAGLPYRVMPSGAGHDSVYMAKVGPIGMIFIPCRLGRSHAADEWSEPAQLLVGAQILRDAIVRCDERLG